MRNNLSRNLFKLFCEKHNLTHHKRRNCFTDTLGNKWGFALISESNTVRQFGEDYSGVVMVNENMSVVKKVERAGLKLLGVSRIAPDGCKFYNAKLKEAVC